MLQILPCMAGAASLIVAAAITLSGCDYDTSLGADPTPPTPTVPPNRSALFRFVRYDQDSDGNTSGSSISRSEWVVDTTIVVDAQATVYGIFDGTDLYYYHYEWNGDLSVHVPRNILQHISSEWGAFPYTLNWITLPFQSRSTRYDTLVNIEHYNTGTATVPLLVHARSVFQRTSSVFVVGFLYTTYQVATTITIDIGSDRSTVLVIYTFAPRIGYFTAIDLRVKPSAATTIERGGYLKRLETFNLR